MRFARVRGRVWCTWVLAVGGGCQSAGGARPPASPTATGTPSAPISASEAERLVTALPEVTAYAGRLRGSSLAIREDGEPAAGCAAGAENCRHVFVVGEDAGDHVSRWHTVSVDAYTRAISIDVVEDGSTLPIETWRQRQPRAP